MQFLGELAALSVTLMWAGTSFAFTSIASKYGAIQLNIDRMLLACIYILIISFCFSFNLIIANEQMLLLTLSGIFGLVIGDSFYFKAFAIIGPRLSILIMASSPFYSSILSYIFLGETLSGLTIVAMMTSLTGIFLVIYFRSNEKSKFVFSKKGVLFALIGAVCQAIGLVITKFSFSYGELNPLIASFYRLLTASIILLPLSIYLKKYINPMKIYPIDKGAKIGIFLGSLFGPCLGIAMSFYAIQHTKIGIASTLMATQPILMLPLTWWIYKEKINLWTIIGSIITIIGVSLLFI
jgi:drug/metabolite transporter (DMT)-like permease